MLTLSPDTILSCLAEDQRISKERALLLLPYLLHLPNIIGSRLSHPVTLKEFTEISRDFVAYMVDQGADQYVDFIDLRFQLLLLEILCKLKELMGIALGEEDGSENYPSQSEKDFMVMNVISEALRQRYIQGGLTFEIMAKEQLGAFLLPLLPVNA